MGHLTFDLQVFLNGKYTFQVLKIKENLFTKFVKAKKKSPAALSNKEEEKKSIVQGQCSQKIAAEGGENFWGTKNLTWILAVGREGWSEPTQPPKAAEKNQQ